MKDRFLVWFAKWFATLAHLSLNQRRAHTGERYHVYLADVVRIIEKIDGTPQMVAAAWLHDVVEDTWVPQWLVRKLFGDEIAEMIKGLTDVSVQVSGSRKDLFTLDLMHMAKQPVVVKTIKLASILAGLRAIYNAKRPLPDEFIATFHAEKCSLINVLRQGNSELHKACVTMADAVKPV